jgi:histidine kinase/DNA gyrase B/HSP90-like ATPase
MTKDTWPPAFTLDQERILHLLTGDRFYSNPSAALREAILNAIDAVHRRQKSEPGLAPQISVKFDRDSRKLAVADNGIGMSREDISALFTKVGASAATAEAKKDSVGEFGIGVISYFMAANAFDLQTHCGDEIGIGLTFTREMLAGGKATPIPSTQATRGTTVVLQLRDDTTFNLLLLNYSHWCREVEGLSCETLPDNKLIAQGGSRSMGSPLALETPQWVERAHLSPVADPTGWDAMTGISAVAVLYRGVFVQQFEVRGFWGIEGSIDVDPKHFKPRLNREGFVAGQFQTEVEGFLKSCHPAILEHMADRLSIAVTSGALDKWTEKRWATLWLSVPRGSAYAKAIEKWDAVFRALPAFEIASGNKWEPVSLDRLTTLRGEVFVAPLAEDRPTDVVRAALHFLRNTSHCVIRGVSRDPSWMKFASSAFGTTADLITTVFAKELPPLVSIAAVAERVLTEIARAAPLFTGPPSVDLVRLGDGSPPVLRLRARLVINIDNTAGASIVRDVVRDNGGIPSLIALVARHAHEQLSEVAAVVRTASGDPEVLSPIRRKYIMGHLQ